MTDKPTDLCGCMRCVEARVAALPKDAPLENRMLGTAVLGWRYACEICGNKRCPHHTNHRFSCTGSNATGQPGSDFV